MMDKWQYLTLQALTKVKQECYNEVLRKTYYEILEFWEFKRGIIEKAANDVKACE